MKELRKEIHQKYLEASKIYGVIFEITHRCPCNCVHCLLVKNTNDELSINEIGDLFRQLRLEGVFQLSLTGGEVFLREDLPQIFELASKDGFFISLITTGVLIGRPEISLLKRHRIRGIEISILGARSETHDSIMRFPGAFDRMMQAARMLRDAGIMINFKAIIMKLNWGELNAMYELARSFNARFSASVSVTPRTDGDLTPQQLSLTEDEVAELNYTLLTGGMIPHEESKEALLVCNAGKTIAGISPQGDIYPCIILRHPVGSIRERSLKDIWHDKPDPFLRELRIMKPQDVYACYICNIRSFCGRCPGLAYLETKTIFSAVPSACILARGLSQARMRASFLTDTRRCTSPKKKGGNQR